MAFPQRVGMPGVFTPLIKLPVHLRQAPAIHQPAAAVHPGLLGLAAGLATPAKGVGRGVVPRPASIEGDAEMKRGGRPCPARALPLVLARQRQLGHFSAAAQFDPLALEPAVQTP